MLKLKESHVYIPRLVLNKFMYRNKNSSKIINYIDFTENRIKSISTKRFNTIKGYYTDENEKKLADFCESKIGNVIKELENSYIKYGINFKIDDKSKSILKSYIVYQMLRDDDFIEYTKEIGSNNYPYSSNYYSLLESERDKMNLISNRVLKNYYIHFEETDRTFYDYFSTLSVMIKFNSSGKEFLLTNTNPIVKKFNNYSWLLNFTLTPRILIMPFTAGNLNNEIIMHEISNEGAVEDYNNYLYRIAKKSSSNILVGNVDELRRVLDLK